MLNRKEDEEFEQRNRIKMLNFGELGEGELIEPLYSDKNRRIYKLVTSKARRAAISRYASEWSAYDKVSMKRGILRDAKSADFSEKCWFWDVKSGKMLIFQCQI